MTSDTFPPSSFLSIRKTSYGGRGYFANQDIPANTTILTCDQPLAYVIFKPFKKEVCAHCFSYDNGKPRKFKLEPNSNLSKKSPSAYAGVYFCTEKCRTHWSQLYDYDGLLSSTLEKIERNHNKSIVSKYSPTVYNDFDISKLECLWEEVENDYLTKKSNKSSLPPLDDVEYDTARMVAFTLVQQYRTLNNIDSLPTDTKQEWEHFSQLQSNEQSHVQQYPDFVTVFINVYKFLRTILDDDLKLLCLPKLLRDTVGREAGNAFGIWELPMMMESECFGTAIYPSASFFNHECRPSVTKKRVDHSMVFTTVQHVSKDEQLFISYGMMESLPYEDRKRTLSEQWHFDCQCSACIEDKLSNVSL